MRTFRGFVLLAAVAAAAGMPGGAGADEGHDDLATGEWEGEKTWKDTPSGAGGALLPVPPIPPSPPSGGTVTPTGGGTTGGTPGTTEPEPGATGTGSNGDGDAGPMSPGTTTTPPLVGPAPAPGTGGGIPSPNPGVPAGCSARWVLEEEKEKAELIEEHTTLTLLLFRNDTYAYICNAYARAESTWYIDWFMTTTAKRDGSKSYTFRLRLEGQCANCAPEITMAGSTHLQARARAHTWLGGIDPGCQASANATSTWTGDLDCGSSASVNLRKASSSQESEIGSAGVKLKFITGQACLDEEAIGQKSDNVDLPRGRTELVLWDRAAVSVYACGTENNIQAKARAGNTLLVSARSKCGATADYTLKLKEK